MLFQFFFFKKTSLFLLLNHFHFHFDLIFVLGLVSSFVIYQNCFANSGLLFPDRQSLHSLQFLRNFHWSRGEQEIRTVVVDS